MIERRHQRSALLFGAEGRRKLSATKVAVVGAGGNGSPLIQQLAYLGVGEITPIDHDRVSDTSLNRLIGAGPDDIGKVKVRIAERMINFVDPTIQVHPVDDRLESSAAFGALHRVDYVFGCVDDDGPRSILLEFCQAYALPFFDLATDTDTETESPTYGGRMMFVRDGTGCPSCYGELDPNEIRLYFMGEDQRAAEEEQYGLPKGALNPGGGPSVVTLNGVVASLAATEFMCEVTGLRLANRFLNYRAHEGTVSRRKDKPAPNCYFCKLRGRRDAAGVERYLTAVERVG